MSRPTPKRGACEFSKHQRRRLEQTIRFADEMTKATPAQSSHAYEVFRERDIRRGLARMRELTELIKQEGDL